MNALCFITGCGLKQEKGGAPVKSWTMFVIAIGCLLIATSPQLPSSRLYLGVGVVLAAGGAIRLYVTRKK